MRQIGRQLALGSGAATPRYSRRGGTFLPWQRPTKKQAPPPRSTTETRARLSLVLLLYCCATVVVIALAPFDFLAPTTYYYLTATTRWADVASTALLFVPLGFLYPLTRHGKEASALRVFLLGLVFGGALVVAQLFEREHSPSFATAFASSVGAGVGALLLDAVNRRIACSRKLAGRLSLEVPLVALAYLLIPLLVASSLGAGTERLRMLALVPLTLLGARLISAVQEHHFGPAGVFRKRSIAVIGAGWTTLGVFPLLLADPLIGACLVLLGAIATLHESAFPVVRGVVSDRRWEAKVIRSVVPHICAYFAIAIFLPLAFGIHDWRVSVGLTGSDGDAMRQIIRLLEPVGALAMMGYVLAEARGRRELPFRAVALRIGVECTCVGLVWECSRAFRADTGASVLQFVVMILASLLGAGIYHHQREQIRWILISHQARARRKISLASVFGMM